jgi:hypothetical protein
MGRMGQQAGCLLYMTVEATCMERSLKRERIRNANKPACDRTTRLREDAGIERKGSRF